MGASVIEVRNLVKNYNGLTAVADICFEVYGGEIFTMVGPNGAGKTTTIEIIEGLRPADGGSVRVFGLEVSKAHRSIKERIGVSLQTTALFPNLTVSETLGLFASFFQHQARPNDLLEKFGLTDKRRARVKHLSGGQQQRLGVALALVNDPEIVFLDEPTSGLDPQARQGLWDIIKELRSQGKTVFLTTHYMEEAERLSDRVVILDYGKILGLNEPEKLIAEHFQESAIQFTVAGADENILRSLPGVSRCHVENDEVTLYSTDATRTLQGLMGLNLKVFDIHIRRASLEDVFLKLTGRRIRD